MNNQKERIKNLLNLIAENPDLDIVPMVDSEVCANDDYCSWSGSWGKAKIDEIYISDDRIYFKSVDDDAEELVECVDNLDWKKVIVVNIELP